MLAPFNRDSVYQTYVYFLAILAKNNSVRAGPLWFSVLINSEFETRIRMDSV